MENAPPIRTALFTTHPIQYQVPWFCRLAALPELDFKVFFGAVPDAAQQGIGFDLPLQWDIPLLEGYPRIVLENVARKPSLGRFSGCNTPGVYRALQSWRPHVAILTGWHPLMMVQALWACWRLRIPTIVRGEANALQPRPWYKRAGHRLLMKGFGRFLAIGRANRDFYTTTGVPADRIFDAPYFVDNERFSESAARLRSQRAELRAEWRIPDNACCFVFAGKMIAKKRPLNLLSAVSRARDHGALIHLLIVGTGDLLEEARRVANEENLPVTFAGFLNQLEIPKAYVAADCLVLPSDGGETWGLVVNEAMACGIPAIVSDRVGCGPDLVLEGRTGSIFPLGDVDALGQRLVAFAADMERLKVMGNEAQERVKTYYSVDRAMNGTIAAIHDAVRLKSLSQTTR